MVWRVSNDKRDTTESGASVMVAAYTNSAVDTILLKLLSLGVPILRLGDSLFSFCHPAEVWENNKNTPNFMNLHTLFSSEDAVL